MVGCPLAGSRGLKGWFNNTRVGSASAGFGPVANPFLPLTGRPPMQVLLTGARTATLLQRLPYLPAADAYVAENGGRIFYPDQTLPTAMPLMEDSKWRKAHNAAGACKAPFDIQTWGITPQNSALYPQCTPPQVQRVLGGYGTWPL